MIAVIRHGDRTPKQKMKMEVKHPRYGGVPGILEPGPFPKDKKVLGQNELQRKSIHKCGKQPALLLLSPGSLFSLKNTRATRLGS